MVADDNLGKIVSKFDVLVRTKSELLEPWTESNYYLITVTN